MGLRNQAENDLSFILEDASGGFGWPITLISPTSVTQNLTGFSDDISQLIDPDTGQAVSGRLASCALRMSTLDLSEGMPQAVADTTGKPWVVQFNDILGNAHQFRIAQSNPDRALGVLTLILEAYKNAP